MFHLATMTLTKTCILCSFELVYRKADNLTLKTESHSNRGSTCPARGSTTTVVADVYSFVSKENNNAACNYCGLGVMFNTANIFLSSPRYIEFILGMPSLSRETCRKVCILPSSAR